MTPGLDRLLSMFKEAIFNNFRLKLFSTVLAIGLFAYFRAQGEDYQSRVEFDLMSRLPPDSARRALLTELPSSVKLMLKGPRRTIDRLSQSRTPLDLDLRSGRRERIVFDPSMFPLPPDVTVLSIDPPSVDLEWQPVIDREVPLQVSITGSLADGFVVKDKPQVNPEKLIATGPSGRVEVLQFIRVAPFDVTGLGEGKHRRRLATDPPPERVRYRSPQAATAESVMVEIQIARRMSEVKFTNRPVFVAGVPLAFPSPSTVDVTVVGPPEVVRGLRPEQVIPRVDLTELSDFDPKEQRHGSRTARVTVDLAHAEAETQPPSVHVKW